MRYAMGIGVRPAIPDVGIYRKIGYSKVKFNRKGFD
jgi:hypothetical protein